MDREFLAEILDGNTNNIDLSIPKILSYLFTNFADLSVKEVMKEEKKFGSLYWNTAEIPMIIFNQIKYFQRLVKAAEVPRSQQQLISLAWDFEKGLSEWFAKATNNKTWSNFKSHFNLAHKQLRMIHGKTIRNTPYHQANNMVEKLTNNFLKQ